MFFLNRLRESRRTAEPSERRKLRERGASALEFALVAPLFFLVVFGGIEIGLMFRSHLALENMSRTAARVASVQRDSPDADTAILNEINRQSEILSGDVTKVVIFAAETLNSEIGTDCRDATASRASECNVYFTNDDSGVQGFLDSITAGTGPAQGLTADQRSQWKNLGIYIEYEYQFATGFFDTIQLTTSSIEVVELNL